MALILLLALLGLFGRGPLSEARVGGQGLRIEYERFVHASSPTTLHLFVAAAGGRIQLAVNRAYLEAMPVEHIRPAPLSTQVRGDTLTFEFAAGPGETQIAFDLRPRAAGRPTAVIRQTPGLTAALEFRQLVYP
jgi:hypothetical protein